MTDHILFFCVKMLVGHDGLLSDMSVGGTSLYQKIPSCPNFYLVWCTLKLNSPDNGPHGDTSAKRNSDTMGYAMGHVSDNA